MGGEVELRHLSDCEPIKQGLRVCASVPLIPRGPEDADCGGASGARLSQPRIRFQTLGSQRCHWNANPVLSVRANPGGFLWDYLVASAERARILQRGPRGRGGLVVGCPPHPPGPSPGFTPQQPRALGPSHRSRCSRGAARWARPSRPLLSAAEPSRRCPAPPPRSGGEVWTWRRPGAPRGPGGRRRRPGQRRWWVWGSGPIPRGRGGGGEGGRGPGRLFSKGCLFRSLRRLWKILPVRMGPRAGFLCQLPAWWGGGRGRWRAPRVSWHSWALAFFFLFKNFIRKAESATPRGKELQIIDSTKTFQKKWSVKYFNFDKLLSTRAPTEFRTTCLS